jgi:hypothetical protein
MKTCTLCGETKPLEAFYKAKNTKDGRRSECAKCNLAKQKASGYVYQKEWTCSNPEKVRAKERNRSKESKRTKASNRRSRKKLSPEDRQVSTEYRKAIKQNTCYYCGEIIEEMHDDHFFPLAKGGTDHWFNLKRACWVCNAAKGAHCGTWFMLMQSKKDRAQITKSRIPLTKLPLSDTRLCKAGLHKMVPDNIASRQCKACKTQRQRERRALSKIKKKYVG